MIKNIFRENSSESTSTPVVTSRVLILVRTWLNFSSRTPGHLLTGLLFQRPTCWKKPGSSDRPGKRGLSTFSTNFWWALPRNLNVSTNLLPLYNLSCVGLAGSEDGRCLSMFMRQLGDRSWLVSVIWPPTHSSPQSSHSHWPDTSELELCC